MTENNSKYQRAKIYKIVSNTTDDVYYGSTCSPLSQRLSEHRKKYKQFINKKYAYITSFKIIETNDYEIVLVEDFPCERKEQILARERHYIENNDCINKNIPTRTKKEYYEQNKDKANENMTVYRKENANKINEQRKLFRDQNKDKIAEQNKAYYDKNQEKLLQQKRNYSNNNKDKLYQKFDCECGGKYTHQQRSKHYKTIRHIEFIQAKEVN